MPSSLALLSTAAPPVRAPGVADLAGDFGAAGARVDLYRETRHSMLAPQVGHRRRRGCHHVESDGVIQPVVAGVRGILARDS